MATKFELTRPPETRFSELPLGLISDSASMSMHCVNVAVALLHVELSQGDYAKVQKFLTLNSETDQTSGHTTLRYNAPFLMAQEHFDSLIDIATRYVDPLHELVLRFGKGNRDNWLGVVHADETTMSHLSQ
jgi:hypothetical protein